MGIAPDAFKASWGWYDKFSRRCGVRTAFVGEQDGGRRASTRETHSLQELHALMAGYDPDWVFTVEETSLFYDALPFQAAQTAEQEPRGRVTLVVSCNSTGRLLLPVCMVGKETWPAEQTQIMAGRNAGLFPLPYLAQERAWLDRATFGKWYNSVFTPFVRERTSKPVLLVVDGERPGHQGDFEDDGIKLVFLPPPPQLTQVTESEMDNSTVTAVEPKMWWSRPLGMGVISALKAQYKYLLVRSALSYHNAPEEVKAALKASEMGVDKYTGGVHFGHTPTLLDAARLLVQAWSQVPENLLENCFARANLVPPSKLLAAPTPPGVQQKHLEAANRYCDDIVNKIEHMLVLSSLGWTIHGQNRSANLTNRIRAFMSIDDENSFELQRQLQGEINEALSDAVPAQTSSPVVPSHCTSDTSASTTGFIQPASEPKPELTSQVRGILLGITDVASQLRLLPRAGADAQKLAPLQLEGCIAAADQIRHCIQAFDAALSRGQEETQHREEVVQHPTTDRERSDHLALV
ncbi:unnamed protein product [Phytophthora lilii]|uniref:Unnamed protein product n=1 Tax=Phytophthora lilii TaxID=2077276 RepID=A0A9W6X4Y6_9STRA|nr:unnamed protein product [Phytophthora lilii]